MVASRVGIVTALAVAALVVLLAIRQSTPNSSENWAYSTTILLRDGRVLVFGGIRKPVAWLWDPVADEWHPTGSPRTLHAYAPAVVLPNGNVLVASHGASNANRTGPISAEPSGLSLSEHELYETYDPATGAWSSIDSPLGEPITLSWLVGLNDGRALLLGHNGIGSAWHAEGAIFDPTIGTWFSIECPRELPNTIQGLATLADGRVLLVGRAAPSEWGAAIYDPSRGTWSDARANGVSLGPLIPLLDGRVLSFPYGKNAVLYDPAKGKWDSTEPFNDVADASQLGMTSYAASRLADERILVAGGFVHRGWQGLVEMEVGDTLASAEVYEPRTGTWTPTGDMTMPRSALSLTTLLDGRVFVLRGAPTKPDATELYDPATGNWTPARNLPE